MKCHRPVWVTALSLFALAGCGSSSTSTAVSATALLSAAPISSSPTSSAPTSSALTSAAPASAAPTSAAPAFAAVASARARTAGFDIDGDGVADIVATRFTSKHSAVLDVHLGNGKSLTTKAFTVYKGDRSGTISGYDINGDHRPEVFVEAPGGDGIGYDLFQWVSSTLVAVPPPKGQETPYLYIGGGRYYESTFRCTGRSLVQVKEAPAVTRTATLPQDPPFRVTVTTYQLTDGVLSVVSTRTLHARDRAASQALLDDPSDGCGTKP